MTPSEIIARGIWSQIWTFPESWEGGSEGDQRVAIAIAEAAVTSLTQSGLAIVPGWQPIETAPKDGTEIVVYHPEAGVCAAFCPSAGFSWHCMDGANTTIGAKSKVSIPTMTSFVRPPTHWMPLPAPPLTKDTTNGG